MRAIALTSLALVLVALPACNAQKRAARLIEKAVRIDPGAVRSDSLTYQLALTRPAVTGALGTGVAGLLADTGNRLVVMEDSNLVAVLQVVGDSLHLGYTLKPVTVAGEIEVPTTIIEPTNEVEAPPTWWQSGLMVVGAGVLIGLIVFLVLRRRR